MSTKMKSPEQTENDEQTALSEVPETPEAAPLTAYEMSAQLAAEEGRPFQAVDQRTGKVINPSAGPNPAARRAELEAADKAKQAELDAFIATIRLAVGEPAPYGSTTAFDQRKQDDLVRAALERISTQQDDVDRAALASRALQRLDHQNHIIKRATSGLGAW